MFDESIPANATPVLNASDPLTPIYSDKDGNIIAVKRYSPPIIASIEKEELAEIEGGKRKTNVSRTQEDVTILEVPTNTRIVPLKQIA